MTSMVYVNNIGRHGDNNRAEAEINFSADKS